MDEIKFPTVVYHHPYGVYTPPEVDPVKITIRSIEEYMEYARGPSAYCRRVLAELKNGDT